jgi:3-hydroxybutyryl-CoA dehydrogenase
VRDGIATPAEIDRIVKHGYALRLPIEGPFEKADLASLPLIATICRYIFPSLDNGTTPELLDKLIAQGRLGSKSGRGIYEWREGEARALLDERNAEVIRHLQRIKRVKTT